MKNSSKSEKLSLTVGITTCYGDESILDTVKSIRASKGIDKNFRFVIVADRVPIKPEIKKELKRNRVRLIENKVEGSQFRKQKQILKNCQSDLIIFTQDDVLFDQNAIATIVKGFAEHPKTTFISIRNQPLVATSFFEDVVNVGTNIANRIAKAWNNGDNYLSVIGRCMAFRTNWIKEKIKLPDEVVSTDAYRYFENKKHGGIYEYIPKVSVLFKNPQTFSEHLRKSSRFQHQKLEMANYFGDLTQDYKVPKSIILRAIISEFLANPVKTLLYFALYFYTRLTKSSSEIALNANWEVDISTKRLTEVKI